MLKNKAKKSQIITHKGGSGNPEGGFFYNATPTKFYTIFGFYIVIHSGITTCISLYIML